MGLSLKSGEFSFAYFVQFKQAVGITGLFIAYEKKKTGTDLLGLHFALYMSHADLSSLQ